MVEQRPRIATEPVCLPDPTTMQQLIGESAVTSSRGKGKISGERIIMMWLNGTNQVSHDHCSYEMVQV